jgi:ankyrin repeat protein
MAAEKGSLEAIRVLVKRRADPSAVDSRGQTVLFPLLDATKDMKKDSESDAEHTINQTVLFLLRRGTDPTRKDNGGVELLHKAASKGMWELCRILLRWGAKRDTQDKSGKTPADYAKEGGFEELARGLG